jgi:phenylacetic acid degradation operon negative regulatory protein
MYHFDDSMSPQPGFQISPRVARIRHGLVLRSRSILVTVFGDSIAPRAQSMWLGSLIDLVRMFGHSPRLVRTSASRLKADDWFVATRIGRRSYYGLSELGHSRVSHGDRRIWDFNPPTWDGRWTLVVLSSAIRASARQHLERELLWQSFGRLAAGVFAHPHADHHSLAEILEAARAQELVAVLSAEDVEAYSGKPLQTIMRETFRQEAVETAWKQFINRFSPVAAELPAITPAEAFFVRTLLIHEYRRVLLRDPNLPEALLPPAWPGVQARQLCERLYRKLLVPSERFLQAHVQTADGPLMKTPRAVVSRLAGRHEKTASSAQRPFGAAIS